MPFDRPPLGLSSTSQARSAQHVRPHAVVGADLSAQHPRARLRAAVYGLRNRDPGLCAERLLTPVQKLFLLAVIALTTFLLIAFPALAHVAFVVAMTLPFFLITLHRIGGIAVVAWHGVRSRLGLQPQSVVRAADQALPRYGILVPLYKEQDALAGLVEAVARLDYPTAKLDVCLIVEQNDLETQHAMAQLRLPSHMRMVVVPDGQPRTKPRALNFALQETKGDFVVVFDAEDAPEPDQLRKAVATFEKRGSRVACLQARLNVDNRRESWLAQQFAIEYTVLFGALLPVLEALRLPIPLGGTSNHFRRRVLEDVGGWDAFNVTEDADLGIRLARAGWQVGMLDSTTWEEAPVTYAVWRGQRRRWLKGWMQTIIVHSRRPLRLAWDLGAWGWVGFYALMAGLLLSALVHPWVYVAGVLQFSGVAVIPTELESAQAPSWLWAMAYTNLVAGYAAAIVLGLVAVWRLGWWDLMLVCLTMPVYWLLISLAAYRALIELAHLPHYWEKTVHRARQRGPGGNGG